jgi:hydrogenase maturation factor
MVSYQTSKALIKPCTPKQNPVSSCLVSVAVGCYCWSGEGREVVSWLTL